MPIIAILRLLLRLQHLTRKSSLSRQRDRVRTRNAATSRFTRAGASTERLLTFVLLLSWVNPGDGCSPRNTPPPTLSAEEEAIPLEPVEPYSDRWYQLRTNEETGSLLVRREDLFERHIHHKSWLPAVGHSVAYDANVLHRTTRGRGGGLAVVFSIRRPYPFDYVIIKNHGDLWRNVEDPDTVTWNGRMCYTTVTRNYSSLEIPGSSTLHLGLTERAKMGNNKRRHVPRRDHIAQQLWEAGIPLPRQPQVGREGVSKREVITRQEVYRRFPELKDKAGHEWIRNQTYAELYEYETGKSLRPSSTGPKVLNNTVNVGYMTREHVRQFFPQEENWELDYNFTVFLEHKLLRNVRRYRYSSPTPEEQFHIATLFEQANETMQMKIRKETEDLFYQGGELNFQAPLTREIFALVVQLHLGNGTEALPQAEELSQPEAVDSEDSSRVNTTKVLVLLQETFTAQELQSMSEEELRMAYQQVAGANGFSTINEKNPPWLWDGGRTPEEDASQNNLSATEQFQQRKLVSLAQHASENRFIGFDCSRPRGLVNNALSRATDLQSCVTSGMVNQTTQKDNLYLLQEEEHHRVEAWSCSLTRTQIVNACTDQGYTHMDTDGRSTYFDIPIKVSEPECLKALEKGEYLADTSQFNYYAPIVNVVMQVQKNQRSIKSFQKVGASTIWERTGGLNCHRGYFERTVNHEGTNQTVKMVGANVMVQLSFTLKREIILKGQDELISQYDHTRLPCPSSGQACVMDQKTYIWNRTNDETCGLAKVRPTSGIIASDDQGHWAYMSTDNSLTRLVLRPPISKCGRVVWPTNNGKFYLQEVTSTNPIVERNMSTSDASLTAWVIVRDNFLHETLKMMINRQFGHMMENDCKVRRREARNQHFHEHRDNEYTSWVQPGVFSTTSGEVVWTYSCPPENVRILDQTDICYETPRIERINPPADDVVDIYRGQDLFLLPKSRRITTVGKRIPCSDIFLAKYQNVHGQWFTVFPRFRATTPPMMPNDTAPLPVNWDKSPDFSGPGPYTREQLQAMDRRLNIGDIREAITVGIATQNVELPTGKDPYIMPETLFPRMPDPRALGTQVMKAILNFLHTWGMAASVFVSVIILWRLVVAIIDGLVRFFQLKEAHGCGRYLLFALCPDWLLLHDYRKQGRRHRRASRVDEDDPLLVGWDDSHRPEPPPRPPSGPVMPLTAAVRRWTSGRPTSNGNPRGRPQGSLGHVYLRMQQLEDQLAQSRREEANLLSRTRDINNCEGYIQPNAIHRSAPNVYTTFRPTAPPPPPPKGRSSSLRPTPSRGISQERRQVRIDSEAESIRSRKATASTPNTAEASTSFYPDLPTSEAGSTQSLRKGAAKHRRTKSEGARFKTMGGERSKTRLRTRSRSRQRSGSRTSGSATSARSSRASSLATSQANSRASSVRSNRSQESAGSRSRSRSQTRTRSATPGPNSRKAPR